MSQIFKKQKDYVKKLGRNNFDLSFSNNFTTKIGQLTPLLIKEVMPGDKFQIDASIGLRAMPLRFPVQSPLQAHVSFFYVPLRILWENYKDFVSDTQTHEHPYLSIPFTRAKEISTGTLADYLGIPTTYASSVMDDFISIPWNIHINTQTTTSSTEPITGTVVNEDLQSSININNSSSVSFSKNIPTAFSCEVPWTDGTGVVNYGEINMGSHSFYQQITSTGFGIAYHTNKIDFELNGNIKFIPDGWSQDYTFNVIISGNSLDGSYERSYPLFWKQIPFTFDQSSGAVTATLDEQFIEYSRTGETWITIVDDNSDGNVLTWDYTVNLGERVLLGRHVEQSVDCSAIYNPFVIQSGQETPDIKLNILPWRAYECIYNCYYRNHNDIDPFILNGEKQYNRFCTNLGDGADSTTPLNLRFVNYELDYLTSCLLSPQFGDAPLVGVSAIGEFTFEDEQGQTFKVIPKIGTDGNTLTGIDAYQEGTPVGALQRLNSAIKYGLSISDFRNVNSLQHFLENHLRRGLKYEDVISSHYGTTSMRYKAADEPTYLGGFTRTIDVTQINATAQSDDIKLGDYVGQAGLFSRSKHSVNHYCDENGFIIGLLHITPIPTYSQLLPKMYLRDNLLSYPFPNEFRHIGLQPIDYREVTPIQAKVYQKPYSDTFGYQRPYYDLIASTDENHGQFRTSMQGYVFTRNFADPPELGRQFITVNPSQMTNPFIDISTAADTFLGQVSFDIKAKRPLPRIHEPRLE